MALTIIILHFNRKYQYHLNKANINTNNTHNRQYITHNNNNNNTHNNIIEYNNIIV